jgi:uncharacterized membrane protein (UPF0136 family)
LASKSLPETCIRVYQKSIIEGLVQGHVYSMPLLLKRRADLRGSVLALVGTQIDLGFPAHKYGHHAAKTVSAGILLLGRKIL